MKIRERNSVIVMAEKYSGGHRQVFKYRDIVWGENRDPLSRYVGM